MGGRTKIREVEHTRQSTRFIACYRERITKEEGRVLFLRHFFFLLIINFSFSLSPFVDG